MSFDMSPAPKRSDDAPPRDSPSNRLPEDHGEDPPAVIMNANGESDSEASENETTVQNDGQLENDGYQLLSTEPIASTENETEEPQSVVTNEAMPGDGAHACAVQAQRIPSELDPDLCIPHQPRWDSVDLDAQKVEDIKSRMSKFVLPPNQHPAWALEVAEHDWKEHLLENIRKRTSEESHEN